MSDAVAWPKVYAVNRAGTHGWTTTGTLGFFAAAAVLLIQRCHQVAMLPPGILRDRCRSDANLVMFLIGAGMFATLFFLTLHMQGVKGYGPMRTGLAYLPFALGIGLGAGGLGPRLLARLPERTVIVTGLALATAGMVWFTALTPTTGHFAVLLPARFVAGIGLGLCLVTATIIGVQGVAPRDTGIASALVNTSRRIGGALGLAVLAAVAAAGAENPALPVSLTGGYTTALLAGGALST
ncbi:MFS transporter [Streptosporangium amethystogenes]|uniref:MFS transporter n=1 Tax=Streptosporangium amethystogenes TaxID=2002 RepID=UPI00068AAC61|nr:MFS transporter [Streptosporangium amethystogenes]